MTRAERKLQHIQHALAIEQAHDHGLDDIQFVHQSIPEISIDEVSLNTRIGELTLSSPIIINAMTGGGGAQTTEINRSLAMVARECQLPIAVGSQMAALKNCNEVKTYQIIRKENPTGIVFANLGSEATVEEAKLAVEMLEANALQIHLNVIQELTMPEGDRDFRGVLTRLEEMATQLEVPIIIKEVGFGISRETVVKILNAGVSIIDVGGYGGTNFARIENKRRDIELSFFNNWGIPTAASLVEVTLQAPLVSVISSGGLRNSLDIAKSISLGASATSFAGYFLKLLSTKGEDSLINEINMLKSNLKVIMTALGVTSISQLQKAPIIISGKTHHWLHERGIDTRLYSLRKSFK
ncbi:type 2 isopentenyl-diphosphate Delta-isomerase [Calidifontibacillus oryziterrae]|uniref:type 2 isopentenyl-diphosphate Delta-isomerase n=1 Tax=Calidifontibacillus oryziterrae TaxID=1191699 RepID=UPI0003032252|nr:type 2 isopentenyl-diphosphate Delta-isomerase [Calidifontibacillus oryziterrae]